MAAGGEAASLMVGIQERERRRATVLEGLARVKADAGACRGDRAAVLETLRARLADWRGLLERQTGPARQILETVLADHVRVTPTQTAEGAAYDVRAEMALGRVCVGLLDTERMASPTGFEPVFRP